MSQMSWERMMTPETSTSILTSKTWSSRTTDSRRKRYLQMASSSQATRVMVKAIWNGANRSVDLDRQRQSST